MSFHVFLLEEGTILKSEKSASYIVGVRDSNQKTNYPGNEVYLPNSELSGRVVTNLGAHYLDGSLP